MVTKEWQNASLLVFGLRVKEPDLAYFDQLRQYILAHELLQELAPVLCTFPDILSSLCSDRADVAALKEAFSTTSALVDWIKGKDTKRIVSETSGIAVLPLLVLMQITQYVNYLCTYSLSHAQLIAHLRAAGGIQSYCGGTPCALAVASSTNETELVKNVAVALRVAYLIGIFGEVGDDHKDPGPTKIVVRIREPGQGEGLIEKFPGTVISAISEPKTVAISGPANAVSPLFQYVKSIGLPAHDWPTRGRWHNPENREYAKFLVGWCTEKPQFQLPDGQSLKLCVRSNQSGDPIKAGPLTDELIIAILSVRSDWHSILFNIANDLGHLARSVHTIVSLGVGDCTPLYSFHEHKVSVSKEDAYTLFRQTAQIDSLRQISMKNLYPEDCIAIVGASCRFPGAANLEELWELISQGHDMHKELDSSRFDLRGRFRASQVAQFVNEHQFYANLLDNVQSFDHAFFKISAREAASMDPQQRVILELAYEAMESAGYMKSHRRDNGENVACFIGASAVDYHENTSAHAPTSYTATGTIRSFLSGKISHYFGWTGPSEVVDTACSSSLVAVHRACKELQQGECKMALAGGINIMTSPNYFLDLSRAGFLSPTGQSKPFDKDADGYCRADGGGLVALKLLSQARRDSDNILALIPGSSTNQGGLSQSITVPSFDAQVSLYRDVLRKARMGAEDISYVEAHGPGTPVGDPIEMKSIREVFGSLLRPENLHIGSIKGNIGHCETAAGIAGLLKVVAMLNKRKIPPQASFRCLNPNIPSLEPDHLAIATQMSSWTHKRRAALVNSYGAAGSNSALIVSASPQPPHSGSTSSNIGRYHPVIMSAASEASVQSFASNLAAYLVKTDPQPSIQNVAYTLNACRPRQAAQIVAHASDVKSLSLSLRTGEFASSEKKSSRKPVVLVFSGQSRRYVGLSKTIYQQYSRLRYYVDKCNSIIVSLGYPSLFPAIFQSEHIDDPAVLQCGLVTSQLAFTKCWMDAGLKVEAIIGHSLGELAGLAVSGALSLQDCLKLVAGRAQLMKTAWRSEKGAMLAVQADRQWTESIADRFQVSKKGSLKVEVACYNAPSSHVLVGASRDIEKLEQQIQIESHGIRSHRLDVSHGFHSYLTSSLLEDLDILAKSLDWKTPSIPLEVCQEEPPTAFLPYRPSTHARQPVFFMDAVRRIEDRLGACIWLEAGLNTSAIALTEQALERHEHHAFVTISDKQNAQLSETISGALEKLWDQNIAVTHWNDLETDCRQIWLPSYQFEKHDHWLDNIDRAAELQRQKSCEAAPTSAPRVENPAQQVVEFLEDVSSGKDSADSEVEVVASSRDSRVKDRAKSTGDLSDFKAASGLTELREILCELSGAPEESISGSSLLADIGVDSLASLELAQELENVFGVTLNSKKIDPYSMRVNDIVSTFGLMPHQPGELRPAGMTASTQPSPSLFPSSGLSSNTQGTPESDRPSANQLPNPIDELSRSNEVFDDAAAESGLAGYWSHVAKDQDELLLSYLLEAFQALHIDILRIPPEHFVPIIAYQPRHEKVVARYYEILARNGILSRSGSNYIRSNNSPILQSSSTLHRLFIQKHPQYKCEADVMALTGPHLASCLTGVTDPIPLLFGSPQSWSCMETLYHNSPVLSTITTQLVSFITSYAVKLHGALNRPIRILEIGAGTGGTTKRLAPALAQAGTPVQYTFTDISHSLLRRAKRTFARYDWIDFETFDLEKSVPPAFEGAYDIVLGTDTVHATSDRTAVMRRLRDTLVEGGIAVISETTRVYDWGDLVFGLLEGWWLAENGTAYPIQPADVWVEYFRKAGFESVGVSGGGSEESRTQQIILGWNKAEEQSKDETSEESDVDLLKMLVGE